MLLPRSSCVCIPYIKSVTLSEPPRPLPVTLPVTRHGTSKEGHQKVNNKKESKEINKKND